MTREHITREIDFVDNVMQNHFNDYGEEIHRALQEAIKLIEQKPKKEYEICNYTIQDDLVVDGCRHKPIASTFSYFNEYGDYKFCPYCGKEIVIKGEKYEN